MSELTKGQQAILDAIDTYGYVKRYVDFPNESFFVTTGKGHRFDSRSFRALERRNLIVRDPDDPGYSHAGTKFIRAKDTTDDT